MRFKIISGFLLFLGLIVFLLGSVSFSTDVSNDKNVRIAIIPDVEEFKITIRGRYEVCNPDTNTCFEQGRNLRTSKVKGIFNGISIGDKEYHRLHLRIVSSKDIIISHKFKERRYRGKVDILKGVNNHFLVVNAVGLEDYIRGVLYHEVSHRWPMEALKVQAVAARTYALYQIEKNKTQDYDVTSDIYSQMYGGRSAERYRTNLAVKATLGEVMTYQGKILPAYYHAACGGMTEDVTELWKEDLPPLKGVVCEFCKNSPHNYWKRNFRSKDIQSLLNKNGYRVGSIKEIKILERNKSGRIKNLLIISRDGPSVTVAGKDFRDIVGPNIFKSNNYEIFMKGYYFDVIGKGWGHGVGMCQWGAQEMARRHYKYPQILQYYYPGIDIINLNKSPNTPTAKLP